jgi:ABC-type lipopolysaccharide export system ATPase subunit
LGPNGAGNHFILYDCGIGETLGNIYLDDMNITDYPTREHSMGLVI